jgi:AhpD family alkylhydroperoxidase
MFVWYSLNSWSNHMPNFYRYTQPITAREAQGQVAEIYGQLKNDLGSVADPIALHAPIPAILAGAWAILRETLVSGQAPRGYKEAVAAAVSARNRCPWCVDIHGMMLSASGHGHAREAIITRQNETITDPALRAVAIWADQPFLGLPPIAPELAPELIGTAVTFHYLNRMVNVLLVESFLPRAKLVRNALTAALPLALRPLARRNVVAGESLRWIPDAKLPTDLAWAEHAKPIASAFAGFAAATEKHGQAVLSPAVRTLVEDRLATWDGEAPGLSRNWVEQAVHGMAEADAVAARVALLASLASYQIDDALVHAFRTHYPNDAQLVAVLAWASFTTARRIGQYAIENITQSIDLQIA